MSQYTEWDNAQIVAQSVRTGERRIMLEGGHYARYAPTGHLVYARFGQLFAVGFDAERIEVVGTPVLLVESVSADNQSAGDARFAMAGTAGTLAFVSGTRQVSRLALVDRDGSVEFLDLPPGPYVSPRASPDGVRLAVQIDNDRRSEIWVHDLSGKSNPRRLPQEGNNRVPIWTPDGRWITFASDREGVWSIYWQPADGSGAAELLVRGEKGSEYWPDSWSPDGAIFSFTDRKVARWDIWTFDSRTEEKSRFFPETSNDLTAGAHFSPDGRWVAYERTEGLGVSTTAVYVRPFPRTGVEQRITQPPSGGPVWSPAGGGLFYHVGASAGGYETIRRIAVSTNGAVTTGNERPLPGELLVSPSFHRNYDVMPDQRILLVTEGESTRPQINIVLNWFEELKQRVPAP